MAEVPTGNDIALVDRLARVVLRAPRIVDKWSPKLPDAPACWDIQDIYHAAQIDSASPTSKDIRVLDLEPAKDYDAPLVGHLRVLTLSENETGPFSALSYV